MNRKSQFFHAIPIGLLLFSELNWAASVTTNLWEVDSVELFSDTEQVEVRLSNSAPLPLDCEGDVLMFDYAPGTASELYYAMLMTAQSTGMKVSILYNDDAGAGMCVIQQVNVVSEP